MGSIHRLPIHLQNQIAAGEVVERPASVVKELVENALDAGARSIRIDLEASGKKMIRVIDDGNGISPDDARLAVEKHTTSKLHREEDLWGLTTLGFRGEALASIASISRLDLLTAVAQASAGTHIHMEGSGILSQSPAPPVRGTTISVKDLFFNTPARRKFLKTDATELYQTMDVVTQHAIANPSVAFSVSNNGRQVLNAPATSDGRGRIQDLFGTDFFRHLKPVQTPEDSKVSVRGYVSLKDHHASRRQQYLFVNSRPVRCAPVSQVLYNATASLRPEGRHPVYILFIRVPPETVDVNIHPTKREVRFSDSAPILQAVHSATSPLRGLTPFVPSVSGAGSRIAKSTTDGPSEASSAYFHTQPSMLGIAESARLYAGGTPLPETPPGGPYLRLGDTFFAYADGDGLTLVDQHAAHERVLYEQFLRQGGPSSALIIPLRVDFTAAEYEVLIHRQDLLASLGFTVEAFGEKSILLREIPSDMVGKDSARVLKDIVSQILGERIPKSEAFRKDVAALMACHEAVRGGDRLKDPDLENLVRRLESCDMPDQCPHGRPTRIHLSGPEVRKLFRRS